MTISRSFRLRRRVNKHRLVLGGWIAFLFIVFYPTLFMGRVLSPNDVYHHYDPWASVEKTPAQNPLIHDPPTSYYSTWALVKGDWDAFHWNRFVASGVPGFGTLASAVMSPLILAPTLLLPLTLVYSGIVGLKFSLSVALAYCWLREERLGKARAALGGLIFGGAGTYVVWWLWQATNATVLYPALLWAIARLFHGKRNSPALLVLLGVSFVLAGYPAADAYGAWIGLCYFCFLAARERRVPWRELGRSLGAVVLALLIVAPVLSPFIRFLGRTDYLAQRADMSLRLRYPTSYLVHFVDPYRHGDPTAWNWTYDPSRGYADNFVENTVYVGVATLFLGLLGVFDRRGRNRWFWALGLAVLLAVMFGGGPLAAVVGRLPGVKYSPLFRLRVLLPVAFAYLGGCGLGVLRRIVRRLRGEASAVRAVAWALILWTAWDLGGLAGHFYSYLMPDEVGVPRTAVMEFLRARPQPFRIAPSFTELIPNTAQLERMEDIRAHWALEADYRALLRRVDPSTDERANMTLFNSLHTNFSDPILAMLNVKYVIEPPPIDIVRWKVFEKTTPSGVQSGSTFLEPGETISQQVDLDFDPAWSVDFVFRIRETTGGAAHIELRVISPETGEVVLRIRRSASALRVEPRIYVPIGSVAKTGNAVIVEIESFGVRASTFTTGEPGHEELFYERVSSPFIYAGTFPGGRVWENVGLCERYWATWRTDSRSFTAMLSDPAFDFRTTSQTVGLSEEWRRRLEDVPAANRTASIRIAEYGGTRQVIRTRSRAPFLFTTSEKLTPELRASVDGESVEPVRINGMFTGLPLEAGEHEIVLERRLGRAWWPGSGLALATTVVWSWTERRRARGAATFFARRR